MERGSCKDFRQKGGDWQNDGSFFTVFHEFISKNVSMPSDLGELIAYVLLLVISWYALIFAFRFLISLVKPVIVVVAAFFVFQFLRTYEFVGLVDLIFTILGLVANLVSSILAKIMDIIARALV
ncbi:uncharacterized protein LOC108049270 [Drosophila rhopaloa]|uniref:Uncharacterized protein LOC108049270 n=1 Tax=Drosophila rhopaloa TaxID=1041015 RepID=A0A6P4F628_DRORH|nr:uncharacterized protein LOC108049270 [Drosophila rhopaloa]